MIKIAYIIDTIATPSAGTEKQLLMLMNEIDRSKFRPYLICLRNSTWLEENRHLFDVHVLDVGSLLSMSALKGLLKLKKLHQNESFDIVQTFFKDGNMFGTLAAKFCGIKSVISSRRNLGGGYWHDRKWIFILRQLRKITSLYISNSNCVADYTIETEKVDRDKIITIFNGLYLDTFNKIPNESKNNIREQLEVKEADILIGLIANWRPVKNTPLFLQVAFRLSQKYSHLKFIVLGSPPTDEELQKTLDEYNISSYINFLGVKSDILPYLASMDIGVLCSRAESLSNSIIEYTASGLPAVVSQVGGNVEAIGDGTCGLSFEDNNLEDFYDKLEILIKDDNLRNTLGKSGKEFALMNFDYKVIVKKYEDMYKKLCEE